MRETSWSARGLSWRERDRCGLCPLGQGEQARYYGATASSAVAVVPTAGFLPVNRRSRVRATTLGPCRWRRGSAHALSSCSKNAGRCSGALSQRSAAGAATADDCHRGIGGAGPTDWMESACRRGGARFEGRSRSPRFVAGIGDAREESAAGSPSENPSIASRDVRQTTPLRSTALTRHGVASKRSRSADDLRTATTGKSEAPPLIRGVDVDEVRVSMSHDADLAHKMGSSRSPCGRPGRSSARWRPSRSIHRPHRRPRT